MKRELSYRKAPFAIEGEIASGRLRVVLDGEEASLGVARLEGREIELVGVKGQRVRGSVSVREREVEVSFGGRSWVLERRDRRAEGASEEDAGLGPIEAPMTGRVVEVRCQVGDRVGAGTPLVVVEAMKMEHRMEAPAACRVGEVLVQAGEQVDINQVLIRLEADEEAA